MITRRTLERLQSMARPDIKVLSLYLDVNPATGLWQEKTYALERSLDAMADGLGRPERRAFANDRALALALLEEHKPQAKGLVIFVSASQGLTWAAELQVPVCPEIRYDTGPYVTLLSSLLDAHPSYGIALVDDRSARLFVVSMGEIEEQLELQNPVPSRHGAQEEFARAASWPGGGRAHRSVPARGGVGNTERRHGNARQEHLKEAAQELEALRQETGFRRLVLGGPVEALVHFEKELPPQTVPLVIGRISVSMRAGDQEVLKAAMQVAADYEAVREGGKVQELMTRAAKGQMAVLGADQTLLSLHRKKVFELLTARGLSLKGYQCPTCGLLRVTHAIGCPACGSTLQPEPLEDVVEHAVRQALSAGALVEVMNGPAREQLIQAGGLGAFLSYA